MILFSSLEKICTGRVLQLYNDRVVQDIFIDSRKSIISPQSLFFAITGERNNGHEYILGLYKAGNRQFVVEENVNVVQFPEANFLFVKSSRKALQALAEFHRKSFSIPVIGITGSNGKTIIKEWLFQLLPDLKIVKNPGSYNSQVGVPLSVWNMQQYHELGIFEAGISKPREMENLEKIIQPTIGIFSNVGSAHDEGFIDQQEKIREKLKLFTHVQVLVCNADQLQLLEEIKKRKLKTLTWGFNSSAHYRVTQRENQVSLKSPEEEFNIALPFSDKASVENCIHCILVLRYLKYSPPLIQERIQLLRSVSMRLELKQGINNCQVIDDSYNNDLAGLQVGLDFLGSLPNKKTVILSDIFQSGLDDTVLVARIFELLVQSGVDRFIGIGDVLFREQQRFDRLAGQLSFYKSTADALSQFNWDELSRETILVKGARSFQFERITARIQRKIHGTRMEIDLNKMVHNLNFFKSRLNPGVKLMAMVKAFAYGSGSEEVASLLQYHKVDYLGVAYADEGVELRKSQIHVPIMVMNPTEESFSLITKNKLEPVVYSISILNALIAFLQGTPCKIHLEIETGMHRLGLEEQQVDEAISLLKENKNISIASVFSHLAGADDSNHDEYSNQQLHRFEAAYEKISGELTVKPIRHILNSSGILRLHFQMDMVRLGIGLYGVNPTEESVDQLQPVATLKTVISQIKNIKAGESVGYGRWGKATHDMKIATIAIGYADGFSRSFSKGVGSVLINNKRAPVFGNVCMDMTMVDITDIDVKEGDDVIIFGEGLSIHEVAARGQTIPYEILTNTSERVKRIFFTDSF
jgi:Alr-MurF fusion protein